MGTHKMRYESVAARRNFYALDNNAYTQILYHTLRSTYQNAVDCDTSVFDVDGLYR